MNESIRDIRLCSRCVYDSTVPGISFDADGVCNYCHVHDNLASEYPSGEKGRNLLLKLVAKIKHAGRGKNFDCIVGISGGCDSSYLLYKAKELGLRPVAVHFDNGWNSKIADENMRKITKKLKVNFVTHSVDQNEYNDIYKSFLKAGVPDLEIPTDIGMTSVLNAAAETYGLSYVLNGHSFRTEGFSPIGWTYMDGKYIEDVQKIYGTYELMTFPNMKMIRFLKWMLIHRIKRIRPLWYIDYCKEEVKKFLVDEFGWQWYGGHHFENRFTAFITSYFLPVRWGIDKRKTEFSALIRSGQMNRHYALSKLKQQPYLEDALIELVQKRLRLSNAEFDQLLHLPQRSYKDFKTYKRTFELMRPFFWIMSRMNYVPKSFYLKYAKKNFCEGT